MWWPFRRRHGGAESRFVPIAPSKLRLGMYVWLPCRWYQHPFPSSRFTLTHAQQLDIIRRLALRTVYYDPVWSDCGGAESLPSVSDRPAIAPHGSTAMIPSLPSHSPPHARLTSTIQIYQQTVQQTESVLREAVKPDPAKAGHQAHHLILQLTQQLMNGTLSSGIAHAVMIGQQRHTAAMHALETTLLTLAVGRELALSPKELQHVGIAALLHDLGEYIDVDPGRMPVATTMPSKSRRRHPEYGHRFIQHMSNVHPDVAEIVLQHHELLDGSGYPLQLRGEAIHPLARLLCVVDTYIELVNEADSSRCTPQQALSDLYVVRRAQVAHEAVVALVRALTIYPPGSFVELTDGTIGLVVQIHHQHPLQPLLMVHRPDASPSGSCLVDLIDPEAPTIFTTLRPCEIPSEILRSLTQQDALQYLLGA